MHVYTTPWVKKGDTIFLSISLLNIDRFLQCFHRHTQLETWNNIINKDPTSPQMCCYIALWNINVRKSSDVLPVIGGFSRSVKAVMHSLNIRWPWRENQRLLLPWGASESTVVTCHTAGVWRLLRVTSYNKNRQCTGAHACIHLTWYVASQ